MLIFFYNGRKRVISSVILMHQTWREVQMQCLRWVTIPVFIFDAASAFFYCTSRSTVHHSFPLPIVSLTVLALTDQDTAQLHQLLTWISLANTVLMDLAPMSIVAQTAATLSSVLLARVSELTSRTPNSINSPAAIPDTLEGRLELARRTLSSSKPSPTGLSASNSNFSPSLLSHRSDQRQYMSDLLSQSGLQNDVLWLTTTAMVYDSIFPGLEALCAPASVPALSMFLDSCQSNPAFGRSTGSS